MAFKNWRATVGSLSSGYNSTILGYGAATALDGAIDPAGTQDITVERELGFPEKGSIIIDRGNACEEECDYDGIAHDTLKNVVITTTHSSAEDVELRNRYVQLNAAKCLILPKDEQMYNITSGIFEIEFYQTALQNAYYGFILEEESNNYAHFVGIRNETTFGVKALRSRYDYDTDVWTLIATGSNDYSPLSLDALHTLSLEYSYDGSSDMILKVDTAQHYSVASVGTDITPGFGAGYSAIAPSTVYINKVTFKKES